MNATGNVIRAISEPLPQQIKTFNRFHWIKFDSSHHDFWSHFWTVAWYVSLIGMTLLGVWGMTFLILHQQAFGAALLGFTLGGAGVALLEYYKQKWEEASSLKKLSLIYEKQPKHIAHHIRTISTHEQFWNGLCEEHLAEAKEIRNHPENYERAPIQHYNSKREAAKAKVNTAFYMVLSKEPAFHGEISDLCTIYERDYQAQAVAEKDARFYKNSSMKAFLVFNDHEKTVKTLIEVYQANTVDLAALFKKTIQQAPSKN